MIHLAPFTHQNIHLLQEWISSEKLNRQWASKTFAFPLKKKDVENHLAKQAKGTLRAFLVIEKEHEKPVGYVEADRIDRVHSKAFIARFVVNPAEQGNGYGRATLERLLGWLKANGIEHIFLNVFTFNEKAVSLYKSLGFEEEQLFPSYIEVEGEVWDRLLMKWQR